MVDIPFLHKSLKYWFKIGELIRKVYKKEVGPSFFNIFNFVNKITHRHSKSEQIQVLSLIKIKNPHVCENKYKYLKTSATVQSLFLEIYHS